MKKNNVFSSGFTNMQKLILILKKPYYLGYKEMENFEKELDKFPDNFLIRGLKGIFTKVYLDKTKTDALLGTAEIALLNLIYKSKYGKFTETLKELVPEFTEKLPIDPFTGKDYMYKKEKDGFLIYSLGPNLLDNVGIYKVGNKDLDDLPFKIYKK